MGLFELGDFTGSGVYCIRNKMNGKRYVGSAAICLKNRRRLHIGDLRAGRHCNGYLQSAWNKYGEENFEFTILEKCLPEDCVPREQFWIDYYKCAMQDHGYNLAPRAGSQLGFKMPQHIVERLRCVNVGNKYRLGKTFTNESREKMSESHKGKKLTDEAIAKLSAAVLGRKHSEETKRKISQARMGNKSSLGMKRGEETKRKMREAWVKRKSRGWRHSPESLKKMSAARAKRKKG